MLVQVSEIIGTQTSHEGVNLRSGLVDVKAEMNEETIDFVQNEFKKNAKRVFQLTWTGEERVPRGAVLAGKEIGFTQNGIASTLEGEPIGHYDRILAVSGPNKESIMIVYLNPDLAEPVLN